MGYFEYDQDVVDYWEFVVIEVEWIIVNNVLFFGYEVNYLYSFYLVVKQVDVDDFDKLFIVLYDDGLIGFY